MKPSHFLLLLLSFGLLLSCCKDEERCKDEEPSKETVYYVSDENKLKIPFRSDGLDTLVYVSNTGETATLYGEGKQILWYNESVNRNANPDCPFYDYYKYENILYLFKTINQSITMVLNYKVLEPSISVLHHSALHVNINNSSRFMYLDDSNNESIYKDTVQVSSNTFKGIKLTLDSNTDLIYNYKFGILRFRSINKTWTKKM